jgi:hypothetical protein
MLGQRRKNGIAAARRKLAAKRRRDREILDYLRTVRDLTREELADTGAESGGLSVYVYSTPPFPLTRQARWREKGNEYEIMLNDRWMPQWKELTTWLKVHLFVLWAEEFPNNLHTFNIKLHHNLEKRWLRERRNVGELLRDRTRREIDKVGGKNRPFIFVVEGIAKATKLPIGLHTHGGAVILDQKDGKAILAAAGRAAGQGLKGYKRTPKAVEGKLYTRQGTVWASYIQKFVDKKDERLLGKRVYMSRAAVQVTREFWNEITGQA